MLRTERRCDPATGASYAWLVSSTAMVNHYYYFYAVDEDFGPFFLKFCSYFPYNAKLCINGHEYLKRQLAKRGIGFEPLDNGILSCADPEAMQRLADGLTADKIDALLRKWLALLPHPFATSDRQQGIRYDISMLQAEFARTEVFDRPMAGRVFFEEVVRENLDMGRPNHVQLIFNRRVNRRTPTRYRTRVITDGVIPSLHVDYKHSRIKQYSDVDAIHAVFMRGFAIRSANYTPLYPTATRTARMPLAASGFRQRVQSGLRHGFQARLHCLYGHRAANARELVLCRLPMRVVPRVLQKVVALIGETHWPAEVDWRTDGEIHALYQLGLAE